METPSIRVNDRKWIVGERAAHQFESHEFGSGEVFVAEVPSCQVRRESEPRIELRMPEDDDEFDAETGKPRAPFANQQRSDAAALMIGIDGHRSKGDGTDGTDVQRAIEDVANDAPVILDNEREHMQWGNPEPGDQIGF